MQSPVAVNSALSSLLQCFYATDQQMVSHAWLLSLLKPVQGFPGVCQSVDMVKAVNSCNYPPAS